MSGRGSTKRSAVKPHAAPSASMLTSFSCSSTIFCSWRHVRLLRRHPPPPSTAGTPLPPRRDDYMIAACRHWPSGSGRSRGDRDAPIWPISRLPGLASPLLHPPPFLAIARYIARALASAAPHLPTMRDILYTHDDEQWNTPRVICICVSASTSSSRINCHPSVSASLSGLACATV